MSLMEIEYIMKTGSSCYTGGVAQMVERSLSMREVPGSIPGASTESFIFILSRSNEHGLQLCDLLHGLI